MITYSARLCCAILSSSHSRSSPSPSIYHLNLYPFAAKYAAVLIIPSIFFSGASRVAVHIFSTSPPIFTSAGISAILLIFSKSMKFGITTAFSAIRGIFAAKLCAMFSE